MNTITKDFFLSIDPGRTMEVLTLTHELIILMTNGQTDRYSKSLKIQIVIIPNT